MLKAVLVFCQKKKSAKVILIFFKSALGLNNNAHFFPIFFKHRILHFSDIAESDHVCLCFFFVFFFFLHHSSRRLVLLFPLIDGRVRSQAIFAKAG